MKNITRKWFYTVLVLFCLMPAGTALAENASGVSLEDRLVSLLAPLTDVISANPWVRGGLVIVITFTIASLLTWFVFRTLKSLVKKTKFQLDDQIVLLLRPPVYYSLLVIGVSAGIGLMPLTESSSLLIGRCIRSIGVIIWIIFFTRIATLLLQRLASFTDRYTIIQNRTLTLFDNAAKIFIFGLGVYAVFVIWKIDMTAWLASAGIAGIAIGFAAKDTLSNLFSGVFIIADAPYKVGDYIVLDRGDRGQVLNIGLRSTRILTRDDIEITIPNSIIGNTTIINQSGGPSPKMRLRVKIGVAYGSDIDQVRRVLMEVAEKETLVCIVPKPRVRFRTFGASSLDFELLCWIDDPELRGRALDNLNTAVYKSFALENIEIPYSKQDLYIKELPEGFSLPQEKKQ